MMKRLQYIEDYIVLMADDPLTWPPKDTLIKLARYDEPIVNSMAEQIERQSGFTDRQAVLAHKLVIKYKKQWAAAGYDVSSQELDAEFRLPIRVIDRSRRVDIVNGEVEIRFPYDQNMIAQIRAGVNEIPGRLIFDRERRCWVAAAIEPRILWARDFARKNNFDLGEEFVNAVNAIEAEAPYAISLELCDNELSIANAANSLRDYILDNGGFGIDNLIRLVDMSAQSGYQVGSSVTDLLVDIKEPIKQFLSSKEINVEYELSNINLEPVVEYARLVNRWPIYVYESGSSIMRQQLNKYFDVPDIVDRKKNPESPVEGRVVYFNHWRLAAQQIPLLVTTHTLMIGHRRQQMMQCADKVIYFSQQIQDHV